MSEKRRNNKNRILRTGERRRKDRRYAYKYTDGTGKTQFVYSRKLVPADKTPTGKREDMSLREKEKEIQRGMDDGIDPIGKKITVCQLYEKQIRYRENVRQETRQGRKWLIGVPEDDTVPKTPLTQEQEENLLSFVREDKVYHKHYDELVILLGTGLCISELCELTVSDLDFEGRIIHVDHQLLKILVFKQN